MNKDVNHIKSRELKNGTDGGTKYIDMNIYLSWYLI